MILHIVQLPRLIFERRSTAIFGTLIISMLWAGIFLKYFQDMRADERDAERINQNFAMVFEENVLRSIGEIDKALLYLRRSIETRKDTADFHTIVNTEDVLSEIIVQVAIMDSNGIMRASNAGPQPAPITDLSDREHFRAHLNSPSDELFISRPMIGRISRQWSVQFTRRFLNTDGSFGGVVVASLNPEHLTNFFNRIDFGSSASISLIGADGVVRSSGGNADGFALGQDLKGTVLLDQMHNGGNATFHDASGAGLDDRLVTIRKVRNQPLWVSVSTDKKEIFKQSAATLKVNLLAGAVITIIMLAAMERILQSEERARQKAEQLKLTLESMNQGIMLVTNDRQIPVINSRCGELLNLPASMIVSPPKFDDLAAYLAEQHNKPGPDIFDEIRDGEAQGEDQPSDQFSISERVMPDGKVIEIRSGDLADGSFVQTFTDVTRRRQAEEHIARLASEDPLTGLPNRRVFLSRLEELYENANRDLVGEAAETFAVLFLDLDRFKAINDTLGHRIGDLLLQDVAARLQRLIDPEDLLARLGGDEFAVTVPSNPSRSTLEDLADRIITAVAQPYEIDGYRIRSSVSVGIAIGPNDGSSADDVLMAADLALYAVKADRRGTYKFYQKSMNIEANERRQTEMDLREALEKNELELYYQPIVDLNREVVTGFEALARWHHPVRGLVSPVNFIPVAEDSGLILPIGEWSLNEACRQAAKWPDPLKVAVNLSPVQFSAPNLVPMIENILSDTGLAPHRLELEITERVFLEDSDNTLQTLKRLKAIGIRISLDDFGTGYSSLSYLQSFPFDKIKIDRTFISDLAGGGQHVVIVQAVVGIARSLGMMTTAEGVESEVQKEFLAALGCDEAQGFHLGAPTQLKNVAEIIETRAKRRAA